MDHIDELMNILNSIINLLNMTSRDKKTKKRLEIVCRKLRSVIDCEKGEMDTQSKLSSSLQTIINDKESEELINYIEEIADDQKPPEKWWTLLDNTAKREVLDDELDEYNSSYVKKSNKKLSYSDKIPVIIVTEHNEAVTRGCELRGKKHGLWHFRTSMEEEFTMYNMGEKCWKKSYDSYAILGVDIIDTEGREHSFGDDSGRVSGLSDVTTNGNKWYFRKGGSGIKFRVPPNPSSTHEYIPCILVNPADKPWHDEVIPKYRDPFGYTSSS